MLEASREGEVHYAIYYPTFGESSKACLAFRSRYETWWEKRGCWAWTFQNWQGSEIDFDGLRMVAPEIAEYFEIHGVPSAGWCW